MGEDELRSLVRGLIGTVARLQGENEVLRQEVEALKQQLADQPDSVVPDDVATMLRKHAQVE